MELNEVCGRMLMVVKNLLLRKKMSVGNAETELMVIGGVGLWLNGAMGQWVGNKSLRECSMGPKS